MKLLAVVSVLAFAACQEAAPVPEPAPAPPNSDGLAVRIATPERIAGSFIDGSGIEVAFEAARSGDNLFMHVATKSGTELLHAETRAETYVFRYLGDRLSLEIDKAWVEQVRLEGPDGPAANDVDQMRWTGDMAVLDELMNTAEMRALPFLSRALGAAGYTGNAYAATLPLHKIAKQTADALGIEVAPLRIETAENGFCSRPTANNCYGMCGLGCTCWSWVCGDCCWHLGCAIHDSWCRNGQWNYCFSPMAVIALYGC